MDVHRISLGLKLGRPVAKGMDTCHTCDVRICVRPEHLYEGTRKQNCADIVARGRQSHVTGKKLATNKSGFGGVFFDGRPNRSKPWRCQIYVTDRKLELGCFDNKIEAALAYDLASLRYHGSHAKLNFGNEFNNAISFEVLARAA